MALPILRGPNDLLNRIQDSWSGILNPILDWYERYGIAALAQKLAGASKGQIFVSDGKRSGSFEDMTASACSVSSGAFTTPSASMVDVTNLSVTLTTHGRPVLVLITSDGTGWARMNAAGGTMALQIVVDGAAIAHWVSATGSTADEPKSLESMAFPAAGSHTIKVQVSTSSGHTAIVTDYVLMAVEL